MGEKKFIRVIPRSKFDEAGKRVRPCLRRGKPNRRVLLTKEIGEIEYSYHATKGWRKKRLDNFYQKSARKSLAKAGA